MSESGAQARLKFRRIRAGWYVAKAISGATGAECFLHIVRTSERHPRWGWDLIRSEDEHTYPPRPHGLLESALRDIIEVELAAEERFKAAP